MQELVCHIAASFPRKELSTHRYMVSTRHRYIHPCHQMLNEPSILEFIDKHACTCKPCAASGPIRCTKLYNKTWQKIPMTINFFSKSAVGSLCGMQETTQYTKYLNVTTCWDFWDVVCTTSIRSKELLGCYAFLPKNKNLCRLISLDNKHLTASDMSMCNLVTSNHLC